jgi:NADPH:quinone reductase-like Zn-dependent oxidoreductase
VVDEIGEGVTDVAVGDRVFGVSDDGAGAAELALLTFPAIIPPHSGSSMPPDSRSHSRRPRARLTSWG